MRNLMDYDGKDVYEAMYVLCCIADSKKGKSKKIIIKMLFVIWN